MTSWTSFFVAMAAQTPPLLVECLPWCVVRILSAEKRAMTHSHLTVYVPSVFNNSFRKIEGTTKMEEIKTKAALENVSTAWKFPRIRLLLS